MERMRDNSRLVNFLGAKREVKKLIKKEKEALKNTGKIGGEVWSVYYGTVSDYDASFSDILLNFELNSLRDVLTQRKRHNLSTNVLDLMGGDGTFLRDLQVTNNGHKILDSGLCITLVDEREERKRNRDKENNIEVKCGEITSKNAWRDIDNWQERKGIKTFDLIVCRGVGGLEESRIPTSIYPYLSGNIWGRLNNNGLFVTQLAYGANEEEILKLLSKFQGAKIHFQKIGSVFTDFKNRLPAIGVIKRGMPPEKHQ